MSAPGGKPPKTRQTTDAEQRKGKKSTTGTILQKSIKTIPQGNNNKIKHNLIFFGAANDIQCRVHSLLVHTQFIVVQDHIRRLLFRLLKETLFKGPLVLERGVRVRLRGGDVASLSGGGRRGGRKAWRVVVLADNAITVRIKDHDCCNQ